MPQGLDVQTSARVSDEELELAATHCPHLLAKCRAFERHRHQAVMEAKHDARAQWIKDECAEIAREVLEDVLTRVLGRTK